MPPSMPPFSTDPALTLATSLPGAKRALARRLFAGALETPGGLKVQTIHAFCAQLLHQFPFEANVTARFNVLDETAQVQLLEQLTSGRAARRCCRARRRARPRARHRHDCRRRPDVSRPRARSDRPARRDRRLAHEHRRRRRGDRRSFRHARHRAARHDRQRRSRVLRRLLDRIVGVERHCRDPDAGEQERLRASPAVRRARRIVRLGAGRNLSRYFLHRSGQPAPIDRYPGDQGRRAGGTAVRRAGARLRRPRSAERRCLPRPQRGAADRRLRGAGALPRRKGAARSRRLRRPDRQDAGAARTASTPPGCTTSSTSASTTC